MEAAKPKILLCEDDENLATGVYDLYAVVPSRSCAVLDGE